MAGCIRIQVGRQAGQAATGDGRRHSAQADRPTDRILDYVEIVLKSIAICYLSNILAFVDLLVESICIVLLRSRLGHAAFLASESKGAFL